MNNLSRFILKLCFFICVWSASFSTVASPQFTYELYTTENYTMMDVQDYSDVTADHHVTVALASGADTVRFRSIRFFIRTFPALELLAIKQQEFWASLVFSLTKQLALSIWKYLCLHQGPR